MFCPNCGHKCEKGLFCGNCGAKLPEAPKPDPVHAPKPDTEPTQKPAPAPIPVPEPAPGRTPANAPSGRGVEAAPGERPAEGILFTNLKALTSKLGSDPQTLRRLLAAYAEAAAARGIRYRLVDASDYRWLNPAAGSDRHTELAPSDKWTEHAALLADSYRFGRTTDRDRTAYLFIIGGEDIIPMPVVRHYMADNPKIHDKDIDTDIPYAYLLGERTYPLLRSGKLFEYEQYFHVGRLPLPMDASIDDLAGYLRRAAGAADGIPLRRYYAQTNLPWGDDSQTVCTPLQQMRLDTAADRYAQSYCEMEGVRLPVVRGSLFYSLPVLEENIEEVFDPEADFYYFNLHGGDQPTQRGFVADIDNEAYFPAISPHHFAAARRPNIVVTEACYGAKYMQYYRDQSMLLTALTGETLLYLGSSRSAFCNNRYPIDNSDRLANVYMASLFNGHTAGEALYLARKSFFDYDDGRLYDQQLVSIVEFNLFGDPSLRAAVDGRPQRIAAAPRQKMSLRPVQSVSESRCLYKAADEGPQSLLETVRRQVDGNLAAIRQTVDRELYARLGVEPRRLSAIFRNRYPDGTEFYAFDYTGRGYACERLHSALTGVDGKVKTIVSTK
ncbi:C25 family cysteine peptidase [Alistipes sp.]|uniref:C25 family cysteine peptidase n=1 Tax=Alistipes sp. TaxID=1872444 RepID=UPI003AF18C1F